MARIKYRNENGEFQALSQIGIPSDYEDVKASAEAAESGLNELEKRVTELEKTGGDSEIIVDTTLSPTSENPVQNKVVTEAIQSISNNITSVGGQTSANGMQIAELEAFLKLPEDSMGAETIYQHLDAYYVTNRTFSSLLDQCTNHGTMMYGFDNSLGSVKTYIDTAIQTAIEDSWEVAV